MSEQRAVAPTRRRILVPIDFSESSRVVLERALEVAAGLDAEVVLLHVADTRMLVTSGVNMYLDVVAIAKDIHRDGAVALEKLAISADPERRRIVQTQVIDGTPVEEIVEFARREKVSLLVMGTHGRTGLARLFIGSVAERVVRLAPCDILVVHGPKGA